MTAINKISWITGTALTDALLARQNAYPIVTGIESLDSTLGGGLPGGAITTLMAGSSGAGKTDLARHIAKGVLTQSDQHVLHVDVELSPGIILTRWACDITGQPPGDLHAMVSTEDGAQSVIESLERGRYAIAHVPSYVEPPVLFSALGKQLTDSPTLVILDSLQRLASAIDQDTRRQVQDFLRALEDFAHKHQHVAFLVISESRRTKADERGTIDLQTVGAESRSVEYASSVLLYLERGIDKSTKTRAQFDNLIQAQSEPRDDIALLKVTKNRFGYGATGILPLVLTFHAPTWQLDIEPGDPRELMPQPKKRGEKQQKESDTPVADKSMPPSREELILQYLRQCGDKGATMTDIAANVERCKKNGLVSRVLHSMYEVGLVTHRTDSPNGVGRTCERFFAANDGLVIIPESDEVSVGLCE